MSNEIRAPMNGVSGRSPAEPAKSVPTRGRLSLAGSWRAALDRADRGIEEGWFNDRHAALAHTVQLPGTIESQGLGDRVDDSVPESLRTRFAPETITPTPLAEALNGPVRRLTYTGTAWYEREIIIPETWAGQRICLKMERCQWESQLWVDGVEAGRTVSLVAPHRYDLSQLLAPGSHRLTLRLDNRPAAPCGVFQTLIAWNGVRGDLLLTATALIWIDRAQVHADPSGGLLHLHMSLGNQTAQAIQGEILAELPGAAPASYRVDIPVGGGEAVLDFPVGVAMWDEHHPSLHILQLTLGAGGHRDSLAIHFGVRHLSRIGTNFALNGRPTFLRGDIECCQHPLTAMPPMEVEPWREIFRTARAYGLNFFRFHTQIPPEAAFVAADEEGIILQVELPGTSCPMKDEDPRIAPFLRSELDRMLIEFGNHPSLCFVSMGNEQLFAPDEAFRARQQRLLMGHVAHGRERDSRPMFTCTTHPYTPGRDDDFFVSAWGTESSDNMPLVGIRWAGHDPLTKSRFCTRDPETESDYRNGIAGIDRPLITHEMGQWASFPNLDEISAYAGVLRPRNLLTIRDGMARAGILDQAGDFHRASSRLALELYKEEIESALRTPGLGGFLLLGLRDITIEQQSAMVGVLDLFGRSKGVTARDFRRFCSATVPLARMDRRVWTTGDTFKASIELAHFGPTPIPEARAQWTISANGRVIAQGALPARSIPVGTLTALGEVQHSLAKIDAPAKLEFAVDLGETIANTWNLWVYPEKLPAFFGDELVITGSWDEARQALTAGRRVLLDASQIVLLSRIPGVFTPTFWTVLMKNEQAGQMGLLIDAAHPALQSFPTASHSDWQWWDVVMRSQTLVIDALPPGLRPIVQPIDNFVWNRRLAMIFEARVGQGKLLVCSSDISSDLIHRPVARQLAHSLQRHAIQPGWTPQTEVSLQELNSVLGT